MNTKKYRLNPIDIVVAFLLLIIVAVFGFVSFKDASIIDFSQKETFYVTVVVPNIHVKHSGLIKSGQSIYFAESDDGFGVIKNIRFEKTSYEYINKANNTSTTYKLPDMETATILIECQGEYFEGGLYVSDIPVETGAELSLYTPNMTFESKVINIQEGN